MFVAATKVDLTTAADAATGGKCWLTSQVGSGEYIIVRGIVWAWDPDLGGGNTTDPNVSLERMTFTAQGAGAVTTCPCFTGDTTTGQLSNTTPTVVVAGAGVFAICAPVDSAAASNQGAMFGQLFWPTPIVLAPAAAGAGSEGLVVRQNSAGDAAESRQLSVSFFWDKLSNADPTMVRRYFGPWGKGT